MKYKAYARHNFQKIPALRRLTSEQAEAISIVSEVFPFKTNNYVVNELIDWDNYETDPLFILNFPQKSMLSPSQYKTLLMMVGNNVSKTDLAKYVDEVRLKLNPHPAGQLEYNVPSLRGTKLTGIQHKYNETMLFFPAQGQTCHAYCTFCFRWPQFTGQSEMKFAMKQTGLVTSYLKENPSISDILITGGDPMTMKASILKKYLNAIMDANLSHLKTIRIGSKSLSFWPFRFISDPDSQEMLDLFRQVSDRGLNLAFMAHINHYRELETDAVKEAVSNIRNTGAQIRTQSPLLRNINDDPGIWNRMWSTQVDLGMIPYYMFVARNTGAQQYFGVSLAEAHRIYTDAVKNMSGLGRTVRGPSMSAAPGKVRITGITEIKGEKVFVLEFLQGRNPDWIGRPFFASFDPAAQWLTELKPAFGERMFFYEKEYEKMLKVARLPDQFSLTGSQQYA